MAEFGEKLSSIDKAYAEEIFKVENKNSKDSLKRDEVNKLEKKFLELSIKDETNSLLNSLGEIKKEGASIKNINPKKQEAKNGQNGRKLVLEEKKPKINELIVLDEPEEEIEPKEAPQNPVVSEVETPEKEKKLSPEQESIIERARGYLGCLKPSEKEDKLQILGLSILSEEELLEELEEAQKRIHELYEAEKGWDILVSKAEKGELKFKTAEDIHSELLAQSLEEEARKFKEGAVNAYRNLAVARFAQVNKEIGRRKISEPLPKPSDVGVKDDEDAQSMINLYDEARSQAPKLDENKIKEEDVRNLGMLGLYPNASEVIAPPVIPIKLEVGTDEKPPEGGNLIVEELPKIKKHYIISADQIVERYARTIAKEKTRELLHRPEENMSSGSRAKSIWNHISAPFRHPIKLVQFAQKSWVRMMEAGYEEKFYREALEKITANQNLLLEFDPSARLRKKIDAKAGNEDDHYEILDKIIEQYSNEIAEMEEQGNPVIDAEVNAVFQKLIADCYLNGWERPEFEKNLKDRINELKKDGHIKNDDFLGIINKRSEEEISEGRMYASNLWETMKDYRSQIEDKMKELAGEHELTPEQKEKLREHVMGVIKLDIQLGAKISDIHNRRPQGTLNATDKLISWAQRTPILGRIAPNPGTMAFIGAGVGAFVSRRLVSKTAMVAGTAAIGLATGAWAPVIGAGIIAGTFGALRRNLELKKDRAMHQQQRVLGKEYEDFRRKKMDNYQYDVKSAKELRDNLELIKKSGEYANLSPEQKEHLADMLARFKLEVKYDREYRTEKKPNRTVDLISVPAEEGGRYGTTLISKTELKKELYEYLRANNLIQGEEHKLSGDPTFEVLFYEQHNKLADNITKADKKFDWHRRRSALLIGALTAVSGSTAAVAGQEFMGFLRGNGKSNYTALDSLKDLWREHVSGRPTKISETVSQLFFQGKNLSPGENTINLNGKDIKLSVFMDPETGVPKIDIAKSSKMLPSGFRFSPDGSQLLHELPSSTATKDFTNNWNGFAKELGQSVDQRISYGEGFYQKTPPEKGIRAMVESAKNLLHNKKINSNLTELMMSYRQGDGGKVIVDASKIIGKELVGRSGGDSIKLEEALAKGQKVFLNLALDNNINGGDGSQFNPIMLRVNKDGTVEVPEKLAKAFFGFGKDGKLLQSWPGNHPGLHQLVLDTGQTRSDGSKIVRGIAATLGEKPEMETEVIIPGKTEAFDFNLEEGKQFDVPYAAPVLAHGPRWQLEEEAKKKEEDNKKEARSKNKEDKKEKKKDKKPPKQDASAAGYSQEGAEEKKENSQDTPPKDSSRKKSAGERFNEFKEEKRKKEEDEIKRNEKKEEEKRQNEERRKEQAGERKRKKEEERKEKQKSDKQQALKDPNRKKSVKEKIVAGAGSVKSAVKEKFSKPKEKNVDEIAAKELGVSAEEFKKVIEYPKKFSDGELVSIITKILGIPNGLPTNKATVKKAYRKKASEWHPDKNPGDKVKEAKFKAISSLYHDYERRFGKKVNKSK